MNSVETGNNIFSRPELYMWLLNKRLIQMHGVKNQKSNTLEALLPCHSAHGNFQAKFSIIIVKSAPRHIFSYTQFLT